MVPGLLFLTLSSQTPSLLPACVRIPAMDRTDRNETSVSTMTTEEARRLALSLGNQAKASNNLSLVFGRNGQHGRNATGNYSLLAKATGLSRVHVGKVLRGDLNPSLTTLKKLEEVTSIDVSLIIKWIQEEQEKKATYFIDAQTNPAIPLTNAATSNRLSH